MTPAGFPHSETCGSKGVCPSPQTIAACRVLHRLPVPRHPPCALDIFFLQGNSGIHIVLIRDRQMRIIRLIDDSQISMLSLCNCQGARARLGARGREPSKPGIASDDRESLVNQ